MALGAFAPVDIAARNARMIIRSPAPTPVAPSTAVPISRLPLVPKFTPPPVIIDPIVPVQTIPAVNNAPPAPTSPAPSAPPATGPTTGTQTGSTGTDSFSRLIDLIGSQYAAQDVSGNLAPVSFASESTDGGAPAASGSPMVPIILAVVVIGGVWLYMKHKGK